jgi:peroxiredoxin Q/BCP
MAIKIGDHFPEFTLLDHNSNPFNINTLLGKSNLIIYFYPKNETYNCTKQACNFRDDFATFRNLNCEVIGVSNDSPKSHSSFKENHKLPFTLLSDSKGEIQKKLELPRNIFGLIPGRITFVINNKGIVIQIIDSALNMRKHIEEALNSLNK